jgi:hypothetical protein
MFWSRIGGGIIPTFAQTSAPEERSEEHQANIDSLIEKPVVQIQPSDDIQDTAIGQEKLTATPRPLATDAMT